MVPRPTSTIEHAMSILRPHMLLGHSAIDPEDALVPAGNTEYQIDQSKLIHEGLY